MQQHCQQEVRRVERKAFWGEDDACDSGHRAENQHVTRTQWSIMPDTHDTLCYQGLALVFDVNWCDDALRYTTRGTTWLPYMRTKTGVLAYTWLQRYLCNRLEWESMFKGKRESWVNSRGADSTSAFQPQANNSHPFTCITHGVFHSILERGAAENSLPAIMESMFQLLATFQYAYLFTSKIR